MTKPGVEFDPTQDFDPNDPDTWRKEVVTPDGAVISMPVSVAQKMVADVSYTVAAPASESE